MPLLKKVTIELSAHYLTLPVPIPDEERKLKFLFLNFFVVPQKGFMKAFKAFMKPFKAPQRTVKIKISNIYVNTTF